MMSLNMKKNWEEFCEISQISCCALCGYTNIIYLSLMYANDVSDLKNRFGVSAFQNCNKPQFRKNVFKFRKTKNVLQWYIIIFCRVTCGYAFSMRLWLMYANDILDITTRLWVKTFKKVINLRIETIPLNKKKYNMYYTEISQICCCAICGHICFCKCMLMLSLFLLQGLGLSYFKKELFSKYKKLSPKRKNSGCTCMKYKKFVFVSFVVVLRVNQYMLMLF